MSLNYFKKTSGPSWFSQLFKHSLFEKITKKSTNLFIRGGDSISIGPQIRGHHEPNLTDFISNIANIGYGDFLIDIGANIGLTTCQNGYEFKKVYCFEPNPLCYEILKVNVEISLDISKVKIYNYGLGAGNQYLDLMIPKRNWGGAFIACNENSYSQKILATKDGYDQIDPKNYLIKSVAIKSTETSLSNIFNDLVYEGAHKGVIKIDVEGMEDCVIDGISKCIPDEISVIIIFENWDPAFDLKKLREKFKSRMLNFYKLENCVRYKTHWPVIFKSLIALLSGQIVKLTKLNYSDCVTGDVIIELHPKSLIR